MRKCLFASACFCVLLSMGCGDTSGDPTAQITELKAAPETVAPGGSTVITATVVKAVGREAEAAAEAAVTEPAWGENVTFRLLTQNGAQLSALTQKTDGKGVAMTVYTAGNNYSNDTIQATLDNGMSSAIVITKSGSIIGARISKLEGSSTTVAARQTAVITATVTDGAGTPNPQVGEPVTFAMATNESGACFINAANTCVSGITVHTDPGGVAEALYRAGGNSPTIAVYDSVRASLSNGSSRALVITRSATVP
ncbi:MAG: hypothetical protein AB1558_00955 [Thermodesulfobacteriota bacterium]